MKLEKLLSKIEEDTKKEIESLQEQHKIDIENIDKEREKNLQKLEKDLGERLEKERKRVLEDYRGEKEFAHEMKLLTLKKKLLEDAKQNAKEEAEDFSFSEKKEALQKKIVENNILERTGSFTVFVPSGKKKEFSGIFEGTDTENIKEKKMDSDGVIVEGERFIYSVSLSLIIDEVIEKESDLFARLLFKE